MWTERRRGAFAALAACAAGAALAAEPPRTVQPGQLTIAVYREFAPFAEAEQGVERGIDVDVGKALAARLGLTPEVREYHESDDVDGDLRNIIWRGHHLWRGRLADVMMHVPTDPWVVQKNEQVRIFAPYFRERLVVARSLSRIPNLPTLQVFTSERIGVQVETLEDRYLMTSFGGVLRENVVHYGTAKDAVAAMLKGEVAAVMGRQTMIEAALAGRTGYQVAPAPAPGIALSGWELGLAVKADNPELAAALERAMAGCIADGTIRDIFARHGVTWLAPEGAKPPAGKKTELAPPTPGERSAGASAAAVGAAVAAAAGVGGAAGGEPVETSAAAAGAPPPSAPPGERRTHGEELVVTATRSERARRDAPAAVSVVTQEEIEKSPAKTTDELLRAEPSFGLFRRSSSLAADPSSQGVNLRGIGPSGVSRSLVLLDGVPVNDPYGGWVYWRSLPAVGTERIELVPGGSSALYGNYALGGVTQVVSSPIAPRTVRGYAEGGSFGTFQGGLWTSERLGPAGLALQAEGLRSNGYDVVAPSQRGPIDGATPSASVAVDARGDVAAREDLTFRGRVGYFWQDQNGGTQYTTAGVKQLDYSATGRWSPASAGDLDFTVFGDTATFTQSRGRTNATRTTEVQAGWQDVPAHALGGSAVFTSRRLQLGGLHTLTAGADGRQIVGTTHEDIFPATVVSTTVVHRDTGGTQWLYGVFVQDVYDILPTLAVQAALRYDGWSNGDASQTTQTSSGTVATKAFDRSTDDQLSPKLGVVAHPAEWATVRASGYQSFRAPTLNELYRPFQVGQKVTLSNPLLGPEKLAGVEAGVDVVAGTAVSARVTGFWTELKDPIVNVTVGTNLAQRQNLGTARIRGVEASVTWRLGRPWVIGASYTYVQPVVTDAPGQPQLVGKDLPQDPRQRFTGSVGFDDPRIVTALAQVRAYGAQYEDDVNTQRLAEFAVIDLSVARKISRTLELFLSVENLLNTQYAVGLAGGLETIGQPRFIHGGVRFATGS